MKIRQARSQDSAALAAIWNPIIRDTLITFNATEKSPAEIEALLAGKARDGHPFLVALDADGILGFATYGPFRAGAGYARTAEHTILLGPAARGRGTGRALMAALEGHAQAQGLHSLIAGVSAANPGGVAFHARIGFREIARLPEVGFKAGQWLDLVLMQKLLQSRA